MVTRWYRCTEESVLCTIKNGVEEVPEVVSNKSPAHLWRSRCEGQSEKRVEIEIYLLSGGAEKEREREREREREKESEREPHECVPCW